MSDKIPGKCFIIIGILIVLLIVSAMFFLVTKPGMQSKNDDNVHIVYFYRPSCENCTGTNTEIERVNQSYPGRLKITKIDISTPMSAETNEVYTYYTGKFNLKPGFVPLVIVNNTIYLEGSDSVTRYFEGIVNGSVIVD